MGVDKKNLGLTLVEVLVSITIISILLVLVVGGINKDASQRVSSLTDLMSSTLKMARAEAIRNRKPVYVIPATSGWGAGWKVCSKDTYEGCIGDYLIRSIPPQSAKGVKTVSLPADKMHIEFASSGYAVTTKIIKVCIIGGGLENEIKISSVGNVDVVYNTSSSCE